MVNGNEPIASGPVGPELLGRLLDRHGAALKLYARQLCDAAEDVVQESLVELASQREAPRDPVAWLYRVVRNRALTSARGARRRKRHEACAAIDRPAWFVSRPGEAVDAAAAADALARLPQGQREVVVARVWGELTFEEIGRLIGASDSAAHRRYQSALRTLREKLGRSCSECSENP